MDNGITPYFILFIDVCILILLSLIVKRSVQSAYLRRTTEEDYNFHVFIFLISLCLFIANSMAIYVDITRYFIHKFIIPSEISLARYIDRFQMCCAYVGLHLLSIKYIPNWFHLSSKPPHTNMASNLALYLDSLGDTVVSEGSTGINMTPAALCAAYPSVWQMMTGVDSVSRLVHIGVATLPGVVAKRATNNENYEVVCSIFEGAHPPRKPN